MAYAITKSFKYQLLKDHILRHIFKTIFRRIYVNKIENRIKFKFKTRYYLKLLTPETMKLFGSTKNKKTKDKNSADIQHLEITEVALVHCNTNSSDYQQDSRSLYTFVPSRPFGQLLKISPTNFIFLKTFNSEFQAIEVWLTDQDSQPLETEDRISLTLVIKHHSYCINASFN